MNFGLPLTPVSGRLFVRNAVAEPRGDFAYGKDHAAQLARFRNASLMVGVVEVPKSAELERMHDVRLNDHLWLDIHSSKQPRTHWPDMVREQDVGGILTDLQYATGFLPDSFEVFLRATMLPHDNPSMRWAFIIAPLARRLDALPKEGLYEFDAKSKGFRHLDGNIHIGEPPSAILRSPIWGPGGNYGFATSMEPEHFPAWLKAERAQQKSRSYSHREFPLFTHRVNERCGDKLVYTAEESANRDAVCKEVLREIMEMGPDELTAALAALPQEAANEPDVKTAPRKMRM